MQKKFLFIVGCPRSGTTPLWEIVAAHSKIALGLERFSNQMISGTLQPELYQKERFLVLRPEDNSLKDGKYHPTLNELQNRYDNAIYIGDKLPYLYMQFERLSRDFPGSSVLFIFRNIFDVAASYVARANDQNDDSWDSSIKVSSALSHWTTAINHALYPPENLRVACISYERLFVLEPTITPIFDFLELEVEPEVQLAFSRALTSSAVRVEKRKLKNLSTEAVFEIAMTAPFDNYRKIVDRCIF